MASIHRKPSLWRKPQMLECLLSLLYSIALAFLLWPLIVGGEIPAFRDSLHFYFPLWDYLARLPLPEQWIPEWNPYDGDGVSLSAEPTTATFYPFRILLHLPCGSIGQRIGLYLFLHLGMAYWGALWAARPYRLGRGASHLTALSYALSGPVFFQIYNPVFLVSAAWLPIVWRGLEANRQQPMERGPILLACLGLSMMIFGGDPQTAYHCLLVNLLLRILLSGKGNDRKPRTWIQCQAKSMFGWFVITLLTIGMTLAQVVPTSIRLSESTRDGDQAGIYDFAIAPWHLGTMLVPNGMGSFVYGHTRWVEMLPWEPRMWVPSLHFGSVGLMLLLLGLWYRRKIPLAAVCGLVIALVSALGWWGGLQVVWNGLLPWYDHFRYPAKWFTVACWCGSLLVGGGAASLSSITSRLALTIWLRRLACICWGLAIGVTLGLLSPVGFGWFQEQCRRVAPDSIIGALDAEGARLDLLLSLWGTTIILSVAWCVLRYANRKRRHVLLWLLTLVQLTLAAASQRVMIPESRVRDAVKLGQTSVELRSGLHADLLAGPRHPQIMLRQLQHPLGKLHLLVPTHNPRAQLTLEPLGLGPGTTGIDSVVTIPSDESRFYFSSDRLKLEGEWKDHNLITIQYEAKEEKVIELDLPDAGWEVVGAKAVGRGAEAGKKWRRMQLALKRGTHFVELRYRTPGLRLGMVGSLIAWFIWLALWTMRSIRLA